MTKDPDVLVGPAFVTWKGRGVKELPVVHDLAFLKEPGSVSVRNLVYLRTMVPRVIRRAERVITVSSAVRNEIVSTYGIDRERIDIVPGAPTMVAASDVLPASVTSPFVLCVGALEPRKNLGVAAQAIEQLGAGDGHAPLLVLVGGRGWRRRSTGLEQRSGRTPGFVHLGVVDDHVLAALYRSAVALIFPSLYEGFGLPVVEALAHGCPVVCSDIPALREVGGKAAYYADPKEASSFAACLRRVLSESRADRAELLRSQAAGFTWQRSALAIKRSIELAAGS
jgi:alpha-1,3-rhamnosyl/mannosyltransferase